eukprot:COSAG02_NODE_2_length_75708_cov_87.013953_43_plen_97_part_00
MRLLVRDEVLRERGLLEYTPEDCEKRYLHVVLRGSATVREASADICERRHLRASAWRDRRPDRPARRFCAGGCDGGGGLAGGVRHEGRGHDRHGHG